MGNKYTKEDCAKLADMFYPLIYYTETGVVEMTIGDSVIKVLMWCMSLGKYDDFVNTLILSLRHHPQLTHHMVNHAQCHDQMKAIIKAPFDEVPLLMRDCENCPHNNWEDKPGTNFCNKIAKWRFDVGK